MQVKIVTAEMSITTLYDCVALALGYHPSAVAHYDCRKIKVSSDIEDNIHSWYKSSFENELGDDWKQKFGMEWVCFGPKLDESLPANTVEVEEGFLDIE